MSPWVLVGVFAVSFGMSAALAYFVKRWERRRFKQLLEEEQWEKRKP